MLTNDIIQDQLKGLSSRAARKGEAERWGTAQLEFLPEHLLPRINEKMRAKIERLAKMAQSVGARVVSTVKFGTLGSVNWGGDATDLDPELEALDLEQLADELLEEGLYSGLFDGVVRRSERGNLVIEPFMGYTEPLRAKDSPTEIIGYVHAWLETAQGSPKWAIRIYDFETSTLYEQRGLTEPHKFDLAKALMVEPTEEFPDGAPTPRYAQIGRGRGKQPLGHIAKLLPLIRSDWASQVRGDNAEEATSFPQLAVKGEVQSGTNERSPNNVIEVGTDGDAWFLEPGKLEQIHEHSDRKLIRLREDAMMPGGFLGNDSPSGEALREANAKFISFCRYLAKRLSSVLTQLVRDYARAQGLNDDITVSVNINREFEMQAEIDRIITLLDAGLVDFAEAVRTTSIYVPNWTNESIEKFILREQAKRLEREVLPSELGNEPATP